MFGLQHLIIGYPILTCMFPRSKPQKMRISEQFPHGFQKKPWGFGTTCPWPQGLQLSWGLLRLAVWKSKPCMSWDGIFCCGGFLKLGDPQATMGLTPMIWGTPIFGNLLLENVFNWFHDFDSIIPYHTPSDPKHVLICQKPGVESAFASCHEVQKHSKTVQF